MCPRFRVGGPLKGCDWAGRFQQRCILVIADKREDGYNKLLQLFKIVHSVFRAGNHPCKKCLWNQTSGQFD